jgi:flap endonuclease-1
VNFYYSKKILPIFCFDGRDSELKRKITKDQLNDFRYALKRYKEAIKSNNRELAFQIATNKEFLWPNIILESKRLLGLLGVPCVDSPASAEAQCAHLVKKKIAQYSNSQDFDSLLFGCPRIVQNLSKSLRRKVRGKWMHAKIEPVVVSLKKTLNKLGVNQFQLIDLGILIGTDYFPGIRGLGPKKALHLVKKHNAVENVIENEKGNYDFKNLTPEIIKKVRKIFLFPDLLESFENLFWNAPCRSEVANFLCKNHHLSEDRVNNNFDKLVKNYEKCRIYFQSHGYDRNFIQTTLDGLF